MKTIFYFQLFVFVIMITSFQSNPQTVPFDSVAAKNELTKTLDQMYLAYNTRGIKTFLSIMADDGLFCGTDAKNLWNKTTYSRLMTAMFEDPSFSPNITVDQREIRFDNNGNSAMVVDQFFFEWNKKIRFAISFIFSGLETNGNANF